MCMRAAVIALPPIPCDTDESEPAEKLADQRLGAGADVGADRRLTPQISEMRSSAECNGKEGFCPAWIGGKPRPAGSRIAVNQMGADSFGEVREGEARHRNAKLLGEGFFQ